MIDHVSVPVRDLDASARFYARILEPLGYARLVDRPATVGFGMKYPEFWLNARPAMSPAAPDTGLHICLRARSVEAVQQFHALAIAHGGTDDGAPGPRQATMVVYYAAFIRDPDGNKIEVMTVPSRDQTTGIGDQEGALKSASDP
jgi:catechol 2,3-dioxygenase-like lactoylglutathione lyase family enzyme